MQNNNNIFISIIIFTLMWIGFLFIAREIDLTYILTKTDIYTMSSIFTGITLLVGTSGVKKVQEYYSFIKQIR